MRVNLLECVVVSRARRTLGSSSSVTSPGRQTAYKKSLWHVKPLITLLKVTHCHRCSSPHDHQGVHLPAEHRPHGTEREKAKLITQLFLQQQQQQSQSADRQLQDAR